MTSSLPGRPAPRVLDVGNSTADGEFTTADLEKGTQDLVTSFPGRVTASAAVSPVHLLVALEGGQLYLLNTLTKSSEPVVDLMSHVTSLSHDAFTGHVYAGLDDLSIVKVEPFSGEVDDFATMPGKGRVAVSPSGKLYYVPVSSPASSGRNQARADGEEALPRPGPAVLLAQVRARPPLGEVRVGVVVDMLRHKRHLPRPGLASADAGIAPLRRWARQFSPQA